MVLSPLGGTLQTWIYLDHPDFSSVDADGNTMKDTVMRVCLRLELGLGQWKRKGQQRQLARQGPECWTFNDCCCRMLRFMQKMVKVRCFSFRKLSLQDVLALQVMVGQRVGVWISICWAVVDRTRKGYEASWSRKYQMCRRIRQQSTIPGIWDSVLQRYKSERGGECAKIHKTLWNTSDRIQFWGNMQIVCPSGFREDGKGKAAKGPPPSYGKGWNKGRREAAEAIGVASNHFGSLWDIVRLWDIVTLTFNILKLHFHMIGGCCSMHGVMWLGGWILGSYESRI